MERVTSESPAQLDQYKPPHSISFIGTPLIITAILACSKPRKLIRESPKAPPDLVAYTPGVDFNTSGNSCVESLASISTGSTTEIATGVLRRTATDAVTVTSPNPIASVLSFITPKSNTFPESSTSFCNSL